MRKTIWKILTLGVMLLIFWFSHQDASASSLQSGWFYDLFHGSITVWMIRKAAHMSIYALLAFCVYHSQEKPTLKKTLLIVILYACSDEFHQRFIPGRNGSLIDVGIDTLGARILLAICKKLSI